MRHLKSAFGFGTRTPGLRLKSFSQVFRYASDFVLWRRHVRMQPKGRCRDRLHAIKPFLHEVADRLHVLSEGRGDTALDWRNLGPQNSFVWRPLGAGDPFSRVPSIQGPISGFQPLILRNSHTDGLENRLSTAPAETNAAGIRLQMLDASSLLLPLVRAAASGYQEDSPPCWLHN